MSTQSAPSRGAAVAAFVTALFAAAALPGLAAACACGCGVFGVGASSLFPSGKGGQAYFEYNFMNQNRNWSGDSRAPTDDNSDRKIKTDFYTLGGQYMFNRDWGVMVEVPYWDRTFVTDGEDTTNTHSALGDIRLTGVYTGFSEDMSTGVTLGVKLPTGEFKYQGFDRDTSIGTGSTDILIGGYHLGKLTRDNIFSYLVQGNFDVPVASQGGYRPGAEFDGALGAYYSGFTVAGGKVRISPVLQLVVSEREKDAGPNSNRGDSGYSRALIAPGIEFASGDWKLYGDVEVPVYQHLNGNQLAAPAAFKVILSRDF